MARQNVKNNCKKFTLVGEKVLEKHLKNYDVWSDGPRKNITRMLFKNSTFFSIKSLKKMVLYFMKKVLFIRSYSMKYDSTFMPRNR